MKLNKGLLKLFAVIIMVVMVSVAIPWTYSELQIENDLLELVSDEVYGYDDSDYESGASDEEGSSQEEGDSYLGEEASYEENEGDSDLDEEDLGEEPSSSEAPLS